MKKSKILFPLFILSLALFLRLYRWQNFPFGFDQVVILENAAKIKSGKFTLIGPPAGPASMFIGPLIYYLTSFLMFLIPPPYTIIAASLLISTVTGIALYYLTQRYTTPFKSITIFSLWAFSPFLINLDRIPWAPSFIFLATSFVFFPLLKGIKKKLSFCDFLILGAGIFLGYQGHFSVLFLYLLVLFISLILIKGKFSTIFITTTAFCLTLLPTLIFDRRHQWLNTKGLIKFLTSKESFNFHFLLSNLIKNFYISLENFGKILLLSNTTLLIIFTGGLFVLFAIWRLFKKNQRTEALLILFWIIIIVLLFSPYSGSTPEYYFLIQFPVFLYLISLFARSILNNKFKRILAFALLACYAILFVVDRYQEDEFSLGTQVKTKTYLYRLSQFTSIKKINYNMELVHTTGLKYLLSDIKLSDQGQEVVVTYAYKEGNPVTVKFPPIGIWIAPP